MPPGDMLPGACMRAFSEPRDDDVNLCRYAQSKLTTL